MSNTQKTDALKSIMELYDVSDKFINRLEELGEQGDGYSQLIEDLIEKIETNSEILIEAAAIKKKTNRALTPLEKVRVKNALQEINVCASKIAEFK